jgi:predicted DNA-binding antitoxin AbrB/MazE fold protein
LQEEISMQGMEPIFVHAVYQDGVIKPAQPLNLADRSKVQLLILPDVPPSENQHRGFLFGALPELAAFSEGDLAWAKRLWEHGAEKKSRHLDDLE